jgi:hypothetical protein
MPPAAHHLLHTAGQRYKAAGATSRDHQGLPAEAVYVGHLRPLAAPCHEQNVHPAGQPEIQAQVHRGRPGVRLEESGRPSRPGRPGNWTSQTRPTGTSVEGRRQGCTVNGRANQHSPKAGKAATGSSTGQQGPPLRLPGQHPSGREALLCLQCSVWWRSLSRSEKPQGTQHVQRQRKGARALASLECRPWHHAWSPAAASAGHVSAGRRHWRSRPQFPF